jgi:hypothetical protein
MDLQQLKHCLLAAGVPEDGYLLVGLDAPRPVREGACIVRPNQRTWEVLVWRPVRVEPSLTFLSEDEACEHALDVLTSAITTAQGTTTTSPRAPTAPQDAPAVPGSSVTPSGRDRHALSSGNVNPGPR